MDAVDGELGGVVLPVTRCGTVEGVVPVVFQKVVLTVGLLDVLVSKTGVGYSPYRA